jgi:hypothetical protein
MNYSLNLNSLSSRLLHDCLSEHNTLDNLLSNLKSLNDCGHTDKVQIRALNKSIRLQTLLVEHFNSLFMAYVRSDYLSHLRTQADNSQFILFDEYL